jgi:hypothetical protein
VLSQLVGNIPAYSYLEEKAFRHGDIEDVISNMAKVVDTPGKRSRILMNRPWEEASWEEAPSFRVLM